MSVSTEGVRVQLQLQTKDGHLKELVRKCTSKGNEVVQAGTFTFIRKRKAVEQPPPQEDPTPSTTPGNVFKILADSVAGQSGLDADMGDAHPAERQQQQDEPGLHLPSSKEPPALSTSEDTDQQQQQQDADYEEEQENERVQERAARVRERDLAADVAGLLTFLPSQCPTALGVTWLLEQSLRLAVPTGNAAGTEGATAAVVDAVLQSFRSGLAAHVAAAQLLLQEGGEEALRKYGALPPMVRQMCRGERVVASMRQQLASLEEEEKAWLGLQEKYSSTAAGAGVEEHGVEGHRPGNGGGGEEPASAPVPSVDLDALAAAQRRADMQLGFQVEAVHSMLDKAERLVEQAQQACSLLQADYHKENFQSYAHINSPQVLVKILSQAVGHAGSMLDYVPASQPSQG